MQTTINNSIQILVICFLLLLVGCRKSPHIERRARQNSSELTTSQVDENKREKTSSSRNSKKNAKKHSGKKLDGAEIFERYGSAVFMVFTSDGTHEFQGSGFFIDSDGLAVSNYHVFRGTTIGNEQIKLLNDNTAYKVTDVICKSTDPTYQESDFIVFKVDCKNTNYIPIAKSQPKIGEKVYAIGSPLGLENTLSSGEVSGMRGENLMQISVPIDHGSSGGALINEYGEVIGITSSGMESQANLNFAWSIDVIKPYLK